MFETFLDTFCTQSSHNCVLGKSGTPPIFQQTPSGTGLSVGAVCGYPQTDWYFESTKNLVHAYVIPTKFIAKRTII